MKEWNEALTHHCDDVDVGLTGEEREQVFMLYTASPLTRCANPRCDELEVKVKVFAKCSRCKKVAYCSRGCQADHWKLSHKKRCVPLCQKGHYT